MPKATEYNKHWEATKTLDTEAETKCTTPSAQCVLPVHQAELHDRKTAWTARPMAALSRTDTAAGWHRSDDAVHQKKRQRDEDL
eukprot:CAMPEP_0204264122 /NCGR_PEP_ID=MMETSP0468-20130131/8800_1 /ASSEMBLY_ACC=CAM_ASM_000383 /TAXON_ID=2969 /ORGANISM="Oxyrrhis marina" /LENGTH=83 /DNA_ID=CAMNT_0051238951 /DNA_START=928 /DNA_END=1179 /DNA_ORIENTATION=+